MTYVDYEILGDDNDGDETRTMKTIMVELGMAMATMATMTRPNSKVGV